MSFYVYAHYRPSEPYPFYIGKGKGYRHKSKQNRNIYWNNIVNRNGYEIAIVESNLTESEALHIEVDLIKKWRSLGACEANLTDGGEGVSGLTGHTPWNKGRTWDLEARAKMSKAKKGKPSPKRKKVVDTVTGIEYKSSHEAAKAIGISQAHLSRQLSGVRNNNTTLSYKEYL